MARAALGRLGFGLGAVWLAATLTFLLIHLAPGGPAVALGGEHGAPGHREEIARLYGLDRPLPLIYGDWLLRVLTGDLGVSYRFQTPVAALIAERAPLTLALMLPALLVATLAGVLIGLALARREAGGGIAVAALAALGALPSYVLAQGLVLIFALGLGWFPVQGWVGAGVGADSMAEALRRLTLPVMALALMQCAPIALLVRARVGEEIARPYAQTARMKGLSWPAVRRLHALPNAALPLITLIGWRFGAMAGGAVVVETVFALPGLGRLAVTAALARDYPVVIGVVLVACAAVVVVNLVVDLIAAWLDPRLGEGQP
jgi:peptide/nickel transport system permease protein